MKMRLFSLLGLFALAPAGAGAVDVNAHIGLTSYSAFKCHVYAAQSNQPKEDARLFQLGFKTGKKFLEIVDDGYFAAEVMNDSVPPMMREMIRQGLVNEPFVLGRIYEHTRQAALDEIIKQDAAGRELPPSRWRQDAQSRATRAKALYKKANCALLK